MPNTLCSSSFELENKEVVFAKPRRCAQRLILNTERASGVQSLTPLLNPVKQPQSTEGAANLRPFRTPRCLSKLGPKPTDLQVPSSFEGSDPVTPPPAPKPSREERDAKHKLLLLLWESYRFQRRQMRAMYSSSASATSSCSAYTSTLNSGGNSPQHRTPPTQHVNSPSHGKSPNYNNRPPSLLLKPSAASPTMDPAAMLYPTNGLPRPLRSPLPSPVGVSKSQQLYASALQLLVPKPAAAPQPQLNGHYIDPTDESGFSFDNVDDESKLLQQGVEILTGQWKDMVGQLDQVWDHLDGDTESRYTKLKIRITSMLLWDNLSVHRSMLSPPLEALRQMTEDHERRLASLPRGSLFHHPVDIANEGPIQFTPRLQLPT